MLRHEEHIEQDIHIILKKYWGFECFRPGQEQIIQSVLDGRDTLALMPTGGGKSLTYQIPALAREGLCLVVTPLIALMKDQVDKLRNKAISAVAIHSGLSYSQIDAALDNCVYGDVKFLFVSPERLITEVFRLRVQRMKISLIAVDEAHCISQWGYDFRPAYLRIAEIRKKAPNAPIIALTASATPRVAEDIMDKLRFASPHIICNSFARPNLSYAVRHIEDKDKQLLRILANVEGSAIIYMRSREGCEKLTEMLINQGLSASFYHAGLPHAERAIRQDEWTSGKVRIMVATNAFGMGIDKADVRLVVHYTICDSIESYYQEAGRAGRDGKRSYAVLLSSPDDNSRVQRNLDMEFPPIDEVKQIYEKICNFLQVAIGSGDSSSYIFNIHEFCSREHIYIARVRSAIKLLQQNGYITLTEELANPARVLFCVSRDDLYNIHITREDIDTIIKTMLRLYNGIFTEFRAIDEAHIAHLSGYSIDCVKEVLKTLWQMHIIRYIPANRAPLIFFNEERLDIKNLYISPESYHHRKSLIDNRFQQITLYAENTTECRSLILQHYFGDKTTKPCGKCDICLAKRRIITDDNIDNVIISLLSKSDYTPRQLCSLVQADPELTIQAIDKLKAENKISSTLSGKLSIIE